MSKDMATPLIHKEKNRREVNATGTWARPQSGYRLISGTLWIDGADCNRISQAGLRQSGVSSKEA
jgi:hypothetical protein